MITLLNVFSLPYLTYDNTYIKNKKYYFLLIIYNPFASRVKYTLTLLFDNTDK